MTYVFKNQTSELADWIQNEINLDGELTVGSSGLQVRRLQEWLTLRGYGLAVDGGFGPVTAAVVARFQKDSLVEVTGTADAETFSRLVEPMRETLRRRLTTAESVNAAVLEYAKAHLEIHPVEIGGQNCGPWVRMYMKGNEGRQWPWCAGFATFILHQATESLNVDMPIPGSFSCDTLVAQARTAGLFVSEAEARQQGVPPGSLFLVRRTNTDWTHVGIVEQANDTHIRTIEGNTNDEGDREGYEVCARSRGYVSKDFILVPPS